MLEDSYAINLEVFEGPLDLLLHLIKKNEVDIYDIPIVEITNQYNAYLAKMEELNLNIAGEFILMASTLVQIKSKTLLPKHGHEDEADPRDELVPQLIEHQLLKEWRVPSIKFKFLGNIVNPRAALFAVNLKKMAKCLSKQISTI